MTPERIEAQTRKRRLRGDRNFVRKALRAEQRREELVALGKTVITTKDAEGNEHYSFPPAPPVVPSVNRLAWLGAKTHKQGISRKNRLTFKVEQGEALVEDASRTFATEVDKILNPPIPEGFIPAGQVSAVAA